MGNTITDISRFVLSITDRCNLNCKYCFEKDKQKSPTDMPLEEMKAIYDKYEPKIVQLFGGEPTLRWNDILEFLDYVIPKMQKEEDEEKYITMTTNGTTNIDFETIPKEYRKNIKIGFSLDGFEEMTDKYRGKGTYKKVHDSVVRCIDAGIFAGILLARSEKDYLNDPRLEEFIRYYVEDIGVNNISFGYIMQPHQPNVEKITLNNDMMKSIEKICSIIKYYHKCAFAITSRRNLCTQNTIHIHTNGYINPRCAAIKPIVGHWTQWNKEDLIKLLNYCAYKNYDCKSTNCKDIEKFAQLLLKKRRPIGLVCKYQ